jgi:hypothetical protein
MEHHEARLREQVSIREKSALANKSPVPSDVPCGLSEKQRAGAVALITILT